MQLTNNDTHLRIIFKKPDDEHALRMAQAACAGANIQFEFRWIPSDDTYWMTIKQEDRQAFFVALNVAQKALDVVLKGTEAIIGA